MIIKLEKKIVIENIKIYLINVYSLISNVNFKYKENIIK